MSQPRLGRLSLAARLAGWLHGCSHRHPSFPITLPPDRAKPGAAAAPVETYIVCLDCGRRFQYDWRAIQVGSKQGIGKTMEAPK